MIVVKHKTQCLIVMIIFTVFVLFILTTSIMYLFWLPTAGLFGGINQYDCNTVAYILDSSSKKSLKMQFRIHDCYNVCLFRRVSLFYVVFLVCLLCDDKIVVMF